MLVFSQSKRMLSMICELVGSEFEYLRLDGDTTDPAERSRLVDKFNSDTSIFAFFLTTQVRTRAPRARVRRMPALLGAVG